ncbi:MAG: sulfotransferase domain-containing protein [Opitutaceae bacterium]
MNAPTAIQPSADGDTDIVLVAGVMRSGQTWLCFLMAHALNARFLEPNCLLRGIVYTGNDYVRELANGRLHNRASSGYSLVVKTHECPDPHFSLTRKVVLIVRDPRDTATSAALRFHVMKTTGSDVEEDAQKLSLLETPMKRKTTFKDRIWRFVFGNRLISIVMISRRWRSFHQAWLQIPFCHLVKFEDLVKQPIETMAGICRYLELPVDEPQLRDTAHKLSMAEIKKREIINDPTKSIGFRKGLVGDFKNHLSRLELSIIRYYCQDTAARLGYKL